VITIVICLLGGIFFGIFLLNKAFFLLLPAQQRSVSNHQSSSELTKEDSVIGCISLIYVDFGFVLLLFLFVMLAMIKYYLNGFDSHQQQPL
jgi:hypothetical protein